MKRAMGHLSRWRANEFGKAAFLWNRRIRKTLVIQSDYAGLGDHLFLSHIPRIAKTSGGLEKVYVSRRSPFRDGAQRSLVWESNPYVDGFVDAGGWPISMPHTDDQMPSKILSWFCRLGLENRILELDAGCNLLDQIMLKMGLEDGVRFHEPEVFVKITKREEFKSMTVYDPNFITNAGVLSEADVERYFRDNAVCVDAQMASRNKSLELRGVSQKIRTETLEDFCSLIVSCKELYCLTTGTATLAAALGKPCTVLYGSGVNRLYHHSKLHRYVCLSGKGGFAPEEIKKTGQPVKN